MAKHLVLAALFLFASLAAGAEEDEKKIPGIQIGKKAPDFELMDQLGKPKKLSRFLKDAPVAIVFHRSAQW